ncbi:hypothetical protein GHT06_015744 [Daphnia sinensis]|uniref:CCHC-type domain-containing protein n=1 Tax=Daphnia sinensis TaxID=1820382 RepID=A0AAD5LAA6_9CRUS|nr:hypothetical protein GHT06_015744 [Daphnia sinensis]
MPMENIDLLSGSVFENDDSFNCRNLLSEAVKMEDQGKLLEFAWGTEMQVEEVPLKPLRVVDVDLNIQVPISLQNIQLLKETSKKACADEENKLPTSGHEWEIGASKLCGSDHEDLDISSVLTSHLQLPNDINIAAKFKKLVLYAGRQCFINNLGSCWVDGKFGTLLLQLPVEGGHEGGHLNIEYQGRKKKFESHTNSDRTFYLSSFYDCCEHFIEPVLQGNKLMLVFDLIWTNAKIEIPRNFPVFLTALKQIKKAIKSWLYHHQLNSKNNYETQSVKHSDRSPSSSVADSSPTIATEALYLKNDGLSDEVDFLYSEKVLKENTLFLVLNEKYDEKFLSFELLRRNDRIFAEALLQCSCLDVHLALAKGKFQNVRREDSLEQFESVTDPEKVKVLEISHCIDSNNVTRHLSIELNWDEQYVGTIQPDQGTVVNYEDRGRQIEIDQTSYGVLVFWPKLRSFQMYCRFGLHSLILQMCKSLASLPEWTEDTLQSSKSDLRQLISFCGAEPEKAWINSGMEKGELTLRLLRFCISLRAREEGLDLLRILGSNFDEELNSDECNFEGIQNEEVAYAIAKFECQVAGWNVIADLIKKLVTPDRIAKQLIPICKLSKFFLNFNCIEGARVIGDCISSSFHKIDKTHVSKSKLCDVQAYVDVIVALEANRGSSGRERIASFILFFSKLKPSLQCRLILDFAAQKNHFLGSLHSWQFVFRDLCDILSISCQFQSPPAKTLASDFMKAIEAWLLELAQEMELRPELQELVEPHIELECVELQKELITSPKSDPRAIPASVIVTEESEKLAISDNSSCQASLDLWDASTSSNSQGDTLKRSSELCAPSDDWSTATKDSNSACNMSIPPAVDCDDWNAASDAWASTNDSQHASKKAVGKVSIDDDWGEKADSSKTDSFKAASTEKEKPPPPSETQPVDDWGACADAWASNSKTTTHTTKAGTNSGSQSSWDQPDNVSSTSSRPIASDDWNSWSSSSNTTTEKTTYTSKAGSSDSWATSEDPWGTTNGRSTSSISQSNTWGSSESTGNSWTSSSYNSRPGGRGRGSRGPPRPCTQCNEEGHTSYNCPTRGRGRGNGGTRGPRPCYKCNQEGHPPYECPTGSTRGRGGGRGAGRGSRVCFKCNEEGHMSYDCPTGPTGQRGGGRGSARPFYQSSREVGNSGNNQSVMDDWGTLTSVSSSRSNGNASERSSEKSDVWATSNNSSNSWATPNNSSDPWATSNNPSNSWATQNSSSDPWATGANTAPVGARSTSSYNAPSRNTQSAVDDWDTPSSLANSTPALPPATSTRRNGTSVHAEPDDWGSAADAWSSVTTCKSVAPSSRASAVATAGGDDWATEADVWSGRSSSSSSVRTTVASSEMNDWTGTQRTTIKSANSSDPRLLSSKSCPFVWNGTIRHRSMLYRINMENLDINSSPDLANLAIPTALRVVGTIEPEKVWNYLRQVRTTSHEKIAVFHFTQAVNAEISYADCYDYFLDGFRKRNWYGVVGSVPDSKLPCTIKDFYITPLPKEDLIPKELETVASARCLRENRFSDLLLAIVVIQSKRPVDQACFGASARPSKVAKVGNATTPVDDVQAEAVAVEKTDAVTESQSTPPQPPSRLTAIRQKLQQDIQSVDPVKARIHTPSLQQTAAKIPLSKTPSLGKVLPVVQPTVPLTADESSDTILEAEKEASPSEVPMPEEKLQIPVAPVDGELLMKQAIMDELNRQIEASKQARLTDVDTTLQSETLNLTPDEPAKPIVAEVASSTAPVSSDGPLTRFRSKRRTVAEKVPTSKQTKVADSSSSERSKENVDLRTKLDMLKAQRRARNSGKEIDIPKEAKKRRCLIEGCRDDAQLDSVYCSDECITKHVQDSLNAMSKEKMKEAQFQEPSDSSTVPSAPNASSDESMWKDSIDYTLLKAQPTPALAAKLLAMTQMRKSMASGNKPANLADDTPVPVMERKTGKILCGASAPTVGNLEEWLKSNSTYEIIEPESLPTKPWLPTDSTDSSTQIARYKTSSTNTRSSSSKAEVDSRSSKKSSDSSSSSKAKVSRKRSMETPKEEETSAKVAKPDVESTRAITRSSLKEALWNRCKDVKDLEMDEATVEEISKEVEESLYSLFKKDVGTKYKSKYRSLIYNIKDPKNSGLFLEIVTKQLTPVQLVKMSTEELASKDLAEWREQEAKRQLNLIKKNEQERLSQVNKYLIKTHKGEEFIKEANEDYELGDDTSKTAGFPDTLPEDSNLKHMLQESKNDLDSSLAFEKKEENSSTKNEEDYRRSSRQSEKKDRERLDRHRSSKSKSKYRHRSRKSDRYEEQSKKSESPEANRNSQSTELEAHGFTGFNDVEELDNSTLNEETPITTADSDTLSLEKKLMKQLIVVEELNRHSNTSKREVIEGHATEEVSSQKGDSVTSEGAVPSSPTAQRSMSTERCCNISMEDIYQNTDKEKVTEEVNQIDTDATQCEELKDNSGLAVTSLTCTDSSLDHVVGNVSYSPGELLIAENDEPFLDLDEQFLRQQVAVEELNSNLTSFIVANNIDIQSHDENFDSSFTEQTPVTPPGMPPCDLKDDSYERVDTTGSLQLECNDRVSDICILNTEVDQSKQETSSSPVDLDNTNPEEGAIIVEKQENLHVVPA